MVQFQRYVRIIFAILLLGVTACGGGTVGTGTGDTAAREYAGTIRSALNGNPISNVQVTIAETNESGLTNAQGLFNIESEVKIPSVNLLLVGEDFNTSVLISDIEEKSSKVTVEIEVDPETDTANVSHLSAKVGMVGLCDYYFENRDVIRQSNAFPQGTECTLRMKVLGDGSPAGNIPIALQTKACRDDAIWETLATTSTGVGKFRGIAQITFPFFDSVETCRYRVVVPFHYGTFPPVYYLIETFTAQEERAKLP